MGPNMKIVFFAPLYYVLKKKSEKIIPPIGSSMSKNGGGATSECRIPDSFYRKRVH